MKARAKIVCRGIVQGIGFRPFVYRTAIESNLTGYVRNQGDAGVLIFVEGEKEEIRIFISKLKEKKPYLAKYEDFQVTWMKYEEEFISFSIIKSSESKIGGISYLPPDISICENCLDDMKNTQDSRYKYPFTSCAICGPRYTTITSLPYDRPNTTMRDFPLCKDCLNEYQNPLDRRYHAQTTCCRKCGPKVVLYNKEGDKISTSNIYQKLAALIEEGKTIAIKGIGGTHLACSATLDDTILRLRTKKGKRKNKPFALMAKDLKSIKTFAVVNEQEKILLQSFRKPIVLLKKKHPFPLSSLISPKLFNVGAMLPYSGIHSLLLDNIKDPAIILTSANPTNLPMYIKNKVILKSAQELADYILLHNRRIIQRADDSVIRLTNEKPLLIRRSRGWVPEPINLPFNLEGEIGLGVGPLLTSTGAIAIEDRCFPTQYIGNVNTLETLDFLESSIEHLKRLLGISRFSSIGRDLHPNYLSNELATKYAQKNGVVTTCIQHHFAHAISLMIDNKLPIDEEIISIVCDGVGYGDDGKIWGGEILHTSYKNYTRVGHLEEQPMIGGDRATYYPIRMVAGILSKVLDLDELEQILSNDYINALPGGADEIQVLLVQLEKKINLSQTTSTGRILAALSSLLHASYERTYEGEPAIVLEALASKGLMDKVKFDLPFSKNNIINTTALIQQSYIKLSEGYNPSDIALSAHLELADQFANIAIDYAKENSIKKIGFSGGVAYNQFITKRLARRINDSNLEFLYHKSLPCGDGGISAGQAVFASLNKE